jgi:hypothetical protein
MNFDHMPELHWLGGYPLVLVLMLFTCLGLYTMFKRQNCCSPQSPKHLPTLLAGFHRDRHEPNQRADQDQGDERPSSRL